MQIVLTYQLEQFLPADAVLYQRQFHHVHIAEVVEVVVRVIYIGDASRHSGSEIPSRLAQHNHPPACHILAAVVASALDNGYRSRVAHTEALTYLAIYIQFAAGGTVEPRISCDNVLLGMEILAGACWWQDRDAPATETLAEVVVALALEPDVQPAHGESSERLSCRTLELDVDGAVGQPGFTVFLRDDTTQHGSHGAVGIPYRVVEVDG